MKGGKPYNNRHPVGRGFICFQCEEEAHYQWECTKKTAKNQDKSLGFRRGKVAKPRDVIQTTKKVQQDRNFQKVDLEEARLRRMKNQVIALTLSQRMFTVQNLFVIH